MPELVTVSRIEQTEELKTYLNDLFLREQYDAIVQAIGMHSILVDPEHMIADQEHLYHFVLNLLKKRIVQTDAKTYSSWLIAFPSLLADLVHRAVVVTDDAARSALASRHAAFGAFSSLDEFYFWALEDRRMTLDQIVRHLKATLELHRS